MPAVEVPFPRTNAPGSVPGESAGRLINCYCYKEGEAPRWRAVPGLRALPTTGPAIPAGDFRGALLVGSLLYAVIGQTVVQIGSTGAVTLIEGKVLGAGPVTMERNNAVPPNIAIVSNVGAYVLVSPAAGSQVAVQQYPDGDLPQPNSVAFLDGYFLFTTRDGFIYATGLNTTTIGQASGGDDGNALSFAKAEARPDGLLRGITYGESYLAMGDETIEVWTDQGLSPFPLQRSAVVPLGLLGQFAVAGAQDGWAEALIFVASDGSVRRLDGYTPTRISPAELDRLIGLADPTTLVASVYTFGQNAIWSLSSPTWTWEFNVTTGCWHERQSANMGRWRATRGVNAFGKWIFGDLGAADLVTIDPTALDEAGTPMTWGMDSAPVKQFPVRLRVPDVSFDFAMGQAPAGGDATVLLSWSHDGGGNWAVPIARSLGKQGQYVGPIRLHRVGLAKHPGVMFRFRISDPVYTSFAGARASIEQGRQ